MRTVKVLELSSGIVKEWGFSNSTDHLVSAYRQGLHIKLQQKID